MIAFGNVAVMLAVAASLSQDPSARFSEANAQYQAGDYATALNAYSSILENQFESSALYYNIGNTHFKLGDLGRAVLFYERAHRLAPRDQDIVANLELARSLLSDDLAPRPPFILGRVWRWWTTLFPPTILTVLVAASYVFLTIGVIAVLVGGDRIRPIARYGAVTFGVVFLVLGLNLLVLEMGIGQPVEAIVLTGEVAVHSAPSDDRSLQIFTVHEGLKVRVESRTAEWAEIMLADGRVGWVRANTFEVI